MSNVVAYPSQPPQPSATILRLPQVKGRTGLSRSSIYAGAKAGTFPTPIKLSERAVGWTATSIDAWVQARVHATGQQVAA
jgi:prophage regulatory protein